MPGQSAPDRTAATAVETRVPAWRLVAFSLITVPIAGAGLPLAVYLPAYYAQEAGLGLTAVGLVFMIGRLWDAASDPLIGLLSDLPRIDIVAAHAFGEKLTRRQDDGMYETATELLVWWLARFARSLARGSWPSEVVAGEAALMTRLANARGLERWVEVWEKVQRLFARAESANLDRKQVVLNALSALETAAA